MCRIRRHGQALLITDEQIAAQVLFALPCTGGSGTILRGPISAGTSPSRLCSLNALCLTLQSHPLPDAAVQEPGMVKAGTAIPNFSIGALVVTASDAVPNLACNAYLHGWS
ncbi:MAG TPA: hypothetical protein VJP02_20420 [Candidatus Sulfotelmatobacter sp.]|nr:hypothetical protein [Candidatus Sulfotelmatobacter sp.]